MTTDLDKAVELLIRDLKRGQDSRPIGSPVWNEFAAHIDTVTALSSANARVKAAEKLLGVLGLALDPLANLAGDGSPVKVTDPLGKWFSVSNLYNAADALDELKAYRTTLASMKEANRDQP